MLTGEEKSKILRYNAEVCNCILATRKEAQTAATGRWAVHAVKRYEGRLIAIRRLADLLDLPADFLPNRDRILT